MPVAPTLGDVRAAAARLGPHLPRTPLYAHAGLAELLGTEVLVKHENHLPTGAFKVRGGVNLVAQLSHDERERGLIAASTGNHGQSLAYAGRLFGVRVTICVPDGREPREGRLDPRARRGDRRARPRLRRGARAVRAPRRRARPALRPLGQRAAPHRRRRRRTRSRSSRSEPAIDASSCRSAAAAGPRGRASSRRRSARRAR